ncbi:hypothetical protein HNQ85_002690 [Anoxybacillus calidus]|uniref:Uncharacterized protein n=1 Tax=[Anoxybacillus] calidus TaxID=575178 RepID=A0A7W0BXI7_9BACL|nr:hypothetical protein [Anoxybacillus calidus]
MNEQIAFAIKLRNEGKLEESKELLLELVNRIKK